MRFDALYLSAVGPFTERRLDLSAGDNGLHVLYGPNEAGKSSALRAVHALLFGFHPQTRDDFVHSYDKLRVGADLRARDGRRLEVFRRKGRKNTLLDADGKALPDDALAPFLGGVNEARFTTQFGIDRDALVAGGDALIEQHGNEAQALFGASLGSNEVHSVLASLDSEAQALFAPRGSSRDINKLIAKVEELRKCEIDATLLASKFEDARRAVDRARRELEAADRAHDEMSREYARLTRMHAARGPLARRARALQVISKHAGLAELPADFATRRQAAAQRERDAGAHAERAQRKLESLAREREQVALCEPVLEHEAAIDAVLERLGVHEKAAADRRTLASGFARVQEQLSRLREGLVPALREAPLEVLRVHLGRQRRSEELIGEHATLDAAMQASRRRSVEAEQQREDLQRALHAMPASVDSTMLELAVREARRGGDLDSQIAQLEADVAQCARIERQELSALGRWTQGLEDLLAAPLPDEETADRFAARIDALDERRRRIAERVQDARKRRDEADEALQAQSLALAPPTEAQLDAARAHRDTGWTLLRARWLDGVEGGARAREYAGEHELADVFEQAMVGADVLADRLRREAAAVHERAARVAARDAAASELEALAEAQRELAADRAVCSTEWQAEWEPLGITPASPVEMRRWRLRAEECRAGARTALRLRDQLAQLTARRAQLIDALRLALRQATDPVVAIDAVTLASALVHAERELADIEARERQRAARREELFELQNRCRTCSDELAGARAALDAWQERWARFTDELSLSGSVTPGELRDHFDVLRETVALGEQAVHDAARLADIDADAQAFAMATRDLCTEVAPTLARDDPVNAARGLKRLLEQQRKAAVALAALGKQEGEARRELDAARADLAEAGSELAHLCALAGDVEVDVLEALEQRDQERRVARAELAEAELELAGLGAGATPESIAQAAAQVDPDELDTRIAALAERIERARAPRDELIRSKQEAERVFAAMRGASDAALFAEQREQKLEQVRAQAQYFLRLRLAALLLREQMNRLQREHSDPILGSAGGYFRTLTGTRYVAVQTDFDDTDQAVLCALRESGERLRVEALSTGTRDQLYLALRLATLEHHLRGAEPLPFVVDDILVQFDDARTRATLQALAEFSRQTQVLLFTHHERVAQDARALGGPGGGVFVHELEAP